MTAATAAVEDPLVDPQLLETLRAIDRRRRSGGLPCPKCLQVPIAVNSPEGWCQPCTTEHRERIKASRRRSYHRNKSGDDEDQADAADGDDLAEPAEDGRNPSQVGELPQAPTTRSSRGRPRWWESTAPST